MGSSLKLNKQPRAMNRYTILLILSLVSLSLSMNPLRGTKITKLAQSESDNVRLSASFIAKLKVVPWKNMGNSGTPFFCKQLQERTNNLSCGTVQFGYSSLADC